LVFYAIINEIGSKISMPLPIFAPIAMQTARFHRIARDIGGLIGCEFVRFSGERHLGTKPDEQELIPTAH
jgi:hypothetical protein